MRTESAINFNYPGSVIDGIGGMANVCFIYPEAHPNFQLFDLSTMVHVVAWDDDIFEDYIMNNKWPLNNVGQLGDRYYDVTYIKTGNLDQISRSEWKSHIGAANSGQYLGYWSRYKGFDATKPHRLINATKHDYNLKQLHNLVTSTVTAPV